MESLVYNNLVRTVFRQVRADGMVAQPGERPPHTREVTGSSPVHPMPEKPLKSTFLLILRAFFMPGKLYYSGLAKNIVRYGVVISLSDKYDHLQKCISPVLRKVWSERPKYPLWLVGFNKCMREKLRILMKIQMKIDRKL